VPQTAPATAPTPANTVAEKSSWSIEDSKSPVDDSPQVQATQTIKLDGDKWAALLVRCKEHETEIIVAAQQFWGTSIGGELVPVLYRINDAPPVEQKWHPGHGGSALSSSAFFPDAKKAPAFLATLPDSGKIFFRVADFQGVTHDMTFPLDGIDEIRARVSASCKWVTPAAKPPASK
jgi:hypothetical protein